MRWLAVPLVFLLLLLPALAQTFPQWADKYVNDFADVLSATQELELRTLLSSVEQNTTAELTVVTLNTTAPDTPSQYRTELFNYWKVGKADKDNGLLVLYAKQEHRIEVEVGYGLEGILPDSKVGRILDETYVPLRDAGNVSDGIVAATKALAQVVLDNAEEVRSGQASPRFFYDVWIPLFILFFLIIPLFSVISQRVLTPKCPYGHKTKFDHVERDMIVYKCEHGHEVRKKRQRASFFVVGGFHGGSGGGGFGGGGSGGGGAGR